MSISNCLTIYLILLFTIICQLLPGFNSDEFFYRTIPDTVRKHYCYNEENAPVSTIIGTQWIKKHNTQKFTLRIENPYDTAQKITVHLSEDYHLPLFQPKEIRYYTEKNLPFVKLNFTTHPWLEFDNGIKSRISCIAPPRIIRRKIIQYLIISNEKSKLSDGEKEQFNKKLYRSLLPILDECDFDKCILEGWKRYQKSCKEYLKKYPKALLKSYTQEELLQKMKQEYYIHATSIHMVKNKDSMSFRGNSMELIYSSMIQGSVHIYHHPYGPSIGKKTTTPEMSFCKRCKSELPEDILYCPHCHTLNIQNKAPEQSQVYCGYCNHILDENAEKCNSCQRLQKEHADRRKICYDHNSGLYEVSFTEKSMYSPFSNNENRTYFSDGKPQLMFDQRICYPYYAKELNPKSFFTEIATETCALPEFRPDLFTGIFCAYEDWTAFSIETRKKIEDFCFTGGKLVLFNASENKTDLIGCGMIIFQKKHILEDLYFVKPLKKQIPSPSISSGHQFKPYDEAPYRKVMFICLSIFYLIVPAIFCYCYWRKRQTALLWILPLLLILSSSILYILFIRNYGTQPKMKMKELSLYDQPHHMALHHWEHFYYDSMAQTKSYLLQADNEYNYSMPLPNNKKRRGLLYKSMDYNYNFKLKKEITINQFVHLHTEHYQKSFIQNISAKRIESTHEKLVIKNNGTALLNGHPDQIEEIFVHYQGNNFHGKQIPSGAEGPLELTNKKHNLIFDSERFRKYEQASLYLNFLEKAHYNYALCKVKKQNPTSWIKPEVEKENLEIESYTVVILSQDSTIKASGGSL